MAVCANGAVIDPRTDRVMSVRTLPVDALAALAEVATRVIPGAGLAVERIGERTLTQRPPVRQLAGLRACVAESDNTEVSIDHLLQRAGDQTADP